MNIIYKVFVCISLFSAFLFACGTESDNTQKTFSLSKNLSPENFIKSVKKCSQKMVSPTTVAYYPNQFHTWSDKKQKDFISKLLTATPVQLKKPVNCKTTEYIMLKDWVNARLSQVPSIQDQRISNLHGFLSKENVPIIYLGKSLHAAIHNTNENIKKLEEFVQEVKIHGFKPLPVK